MRGYSERWYRVAVVLEGQQILSGHRGRHREDHGPATDAALQPFCFPGSVPSCDPLCADPSGFHCLFTSQKPEAAGVATARCSEDDGTSGEGVDSLLERETIHGILSGHKFYLNKELDNPYPHESSLKSPYLGARIVR